MKRIVFLAALVFLYMLGNAQYCTNDNRFTETAVFTDEQICSEPGVIYGSAPAVTGQMQDLILNIYYPCETYDTLPKRPLIVLMHGGMFLSGSLTHLDSTCQEFAKRGFVAATIEYRQGWEYVDNCQAVTVPTVISADRAIYRGIQDLHASMRYLVHNAGEYKIDTAWVFCGGVSAGAFAAVDMAFIKPEQLYNRWPYCNDPKFGPPLGYLNASGNDLTDSFSIKGLFHNWGSIVDINYIQPSNVIPVISFAGDEDKLSPIDSGFFLGCSHYDLMFGSRAICDRLTDYGSCSEMNIKVNGGHGVYNDTYEQGVFRVAKASCFFKSLFCNNCSSVIYTDSVPASCSLYTSLRELPAHQALQTDPNPSNGRIMIKSESPIGSPVNIYDIRGILIHQEPLTSAEQELDLDDLEKGIYVIEIESARSKIIIQ